MKIDNDTFDLSCFLHERSYYAEEIPDGEGWRPRNGPISDYHVSLHRAGTITLGVYPIQARNQTCTWVCWDFDTLDENPVLQLVGVLSNPFLVEHTGGRGRHVWQFFETAVDASLARDYGLKTAQIAGVSCEVFPKQGHVKDGSRGSLIRLPLGKNQATGHWSHFEYGSFGLVPVPVLATLPWRRTVPSKEMPGGFLSAIGQGIQAGVPSGSWTGRNDALFRLSNFLRGCHWPANVVASVVRSVNTSLCQPPLSEEEIVKILREKEGRWQ